MKEKKLTTKHYKLFLILIVGGYVLVMCLRSLSTSLFFSPNSRITILYYGERPKILSIGRGEGVNYELYFEPDKRILVPGGYGSYKIGALGRLAEIEKKPELLTRAFSSVLSARVDYEESSIIRRSLLDTLYVRLLLLKQKKSDYISLNTSYTDPVHREDFSEYSFQKKYKGFFYEKRLRSDGKNVSIVYKTYSSVKTLSRIIEGQGIRVVDVSYTPQPGKDCYIIDTAKTSTTSQYLATTFGCSVRPGLVNGADIQMVLGDRLEGEWE